MTHETLMCMLPLERESAPLKLKEGSGTDQDHTGGKASTNITTLI